MERGYWPWRGYAPPYWSEKRPNDGWRRSHGYNFPDAWASQVRPSGCQPARAPFRQLHNSFPPAACDGPRLMQQSIRRALDGPQERQTRNRSARSVELPGRDHEAEVAHSSLSSPWPVGGRDSHATHSVHYVSAGQPRQVELKVPLLQIPKLYPALPGENKPETDGMAVSGPPSQVSKAKANMSDAVGSKAEQAPAAAEKPKVCKASVPIAAQASKGMAVSASSSKVFKAKANLSLVAASKDGHAGAVPKKTQVSSMLGSKLVPVRESQASESMPLQAEKPVLEPPSQVSKAKMNPSNAVARKIDNAATNPKKLKEAAMVSSKLAPKRVSESSESTPSHASGEIAILKPPDLASKANARLSNLVARETDRGATVATKSKVSSVTDSKPIPVRVSRAQTEPMPPQNSEKMEVSDQPSQASKPKVNLSNAAARKTNYAATKPKKPQVSFTVSEPMPPQASKVEPPDQASKAKASPPNAGCRETAQAAAASTKPKVSSVIDSVNPTPVSVSRTSEPMPPQVREEMEVAGPPSQAFKVQVDTSNPVARKTDNAATKSKVSSTVSSKQVPVKASQASEPMPPPASEMAALEPPDQASKAKASPLNAVTRETAQGPTASTKPKVSSVTESEPIPVRVSQASEPMPPQANEELEVSDAVRKTDRAATVSKKPEVSSVIDSKPITFKVSQASGALEVSEPPGQVIEAKVTVSNTMVMKADDEFMAYKKPKVSSVVSSEPIPVRVSRKSVPTHHTSLTVNTPVPSQKKQILGDESYEDVSDVPLEEYCDGTSDRPSQAEGGVVSGASGEEPQHPSCDKEKAAQLGDYEDVSDTPLTMYDSPEEPCSSVQPAHRKATTKKPLGKKKVLKSTPGMKKAEGTCAKAVDAHPSQQQDVAKPKPVATNKVKAHLATKLGAAKLTATTTVLDSKPSGAGRNGVAVKRPLKRPGAQCSCQDIKKPKVDANSEKRKRDPCASTTQNCCPSPAKKMAAKKVDKVASCTKTSTKPSMANSNDVGESSKDSPTSTPKLAASKGVGAKKKKLEPTIVKTQPKKETGHSSVTTPMWKKDSAKGVSSSNKLKQGSKSTSPGKAPVTKSSKLISPGKALTMKSNKTPPTCTATKAKGKSNCLVPNGLLMTVGSPNPQTQTVAAPAERPPQPHSSKATVKHHALKTSSETSTKACKSFGSSAKPAKYEDMSKAPEPQLGKDDAAQKAECLGNTETAPVCPSSSDVRPGSGLKQCQTSETKELGSEATKTLKSFDGPAMPGKRQIEVKAKGTPCSVAEGQPRDNTSQEPIGSVKEQKIVPVENRCFDVPERGQSCDDLQASGTQKKTTTKAATRATVKVTGIKGNMKSSGAAKTEDRCDSPSTSKVAAEENHGAGKLSTSGDAVKTKHPASEIIHKAAEATTDKEVCSGPLEDCVRSSLNKETGSTSVPLPTDENVLEDQADNLAGSKTSAASPHDLENLEQRRESNLVSLPSCNVAKKVKTDTNVPATQEANCTSGMLPNSVHSLRLTAHTATLANGNRGSSGTSKASLLCTEASTLTSPSQKAACDNLPFTQQTDSSTSVIGQVRGSKQPKKESTVPLDTSSSAETMKQGDSSESPLACDGVATEKSVESADLPQKPLPGFPVNDTTCENTASKEESDWQKGKQSTASPPQQLQGDCRMATTLSSNSPQREQDACAALLKGDAGACKPDPDVEGPVTSSLQDKAIKPSPPKKKSKNKGPGTNTSLRSAWLFSRKRRGKRQRSTEKHSGNSPKKFKAAQGSSKVTGEPSAIPIVVKKEPADDVDTEAILPLTAPPAHCSPKKLMSRVGQAYTGREDAKPAENSAKFKAVDPSHDIDHVAQGSCKFMGGPSTSLIKKEPGTEEDVDTEAKPLLNIPSTPCSAKRPVSPAVQACNDTNPKLAPPSFSPSCQKLSGQSSPSGSGRAETATPLELAQLDLDMFTGLSILDVCNAGAEKLAKLKERIQVNRITKEEAVSEVAKAVHKAVVDEYFKRERAIRTLNLLAKIPFSLDPAKVGKIQQLTQAIVEKSQAADKP